MLRADPDFVDAAVRKDELKHMLPVAAEQRETAGTLAVAADGITQAALRGKGGQSRSR
jgi:hypothetical protein